MDGEEQNLLRENLLDHPSSPLDDNASNDDDEEREMEVMLYSQVHHEAPDAIFPPTSVPVGSECRVSLSSELLTAQLQSVFTTTPNARFGRSCRVSQFNKVGRTRASRYYDVQESQQMPFSAPKEPSQNTVKRFSPPDCVKVLTANRETENQCSDKRKTVSKNTMFSPQKADLPPMNSLGKDPCFKEFLSSNSAVDGNIEKVKELAIDNQKRSTESPCTGPDGTDNSLSSLKVPFEVRRVAKPLQYDTQISQVVSSMLDDESTCAEDRQLVQTRASQTSKSHESSWSVGMSWFDMSSSHFEVESVDGESLCSFPAHENSAPSGTSTNTPETHTEDEHIARQDEKEDEAVDANDCSRYDLHLKQDQNKINNDAEGDIDSEEDSVVEMSVPLKPAPDIVDLSDGEDTTERDKTRVEHITTEDDIIFLCASRKRKSSNFQEILVLDDDAKEIMSATAHPNCSIIIGGSKASKVETQPEISSIKNKAHRKSKNLSFWLCNPIEASKRFNHERLLRSMSDDPALWKLSPLDRLCKPFSPRGAKCINCNQFGHKVKNCPEPRKVAMCHMCGTAGHREPRCPKRMCLKCGRRNHVFVEKCTSCVAQHIKCKICQIHGHEWDSCPDLWRRYHLTTEPGKIIQPEDSKPVSSQSLWCCNCARKGHLSHECYADQWRCELISPFVKSYFTPADEELIIRNGPLEATILLTEEDAKLLLTQEGNLFLENLKSMKNVTIRPNINSTFQSISIIGSSIDQEEIRIQLMEWLAPKRRISASEYQKLQMKSSSFDSSNSLHKRSKSSYPPTSNSYIEVAPRIPQPMNDTGLATKNIMEQTIKESSQQTLETNLQEQGLCKGQARYFAENSEQHNDLQLPNQSGVTYQQSMMMQAKNVLEIQDRGTNSVVVPKQSITSTLEEIQRSRLVTYLDHTSEIFKPRTALHLKRFLTHKLKLINRQKIKNIERMYSNITELLKQSRLSASRQKNLRSLSRQINMALLGKHQIGPGRKHIEALQAILDELQTKHVKEITKNRFRKLHARFSENYVPIFTCCYRKDLAELMKEYRCKCGPNVRDDVKNDLTPKL